MVVFVGFLTTFGKRVFVLEEVSDGRLGGQLWAFVQSKRWAALPTTLLLSAGLPAAAHRVRPEDEAYNGFTAEQVLEFASLASNEANKDDPIDSAVLRAYAKSKVRMAWGTWGIVDP